jgi:prepilin signal peptidase PulO-like enzyme (type II secretory pathway)
MERIIIGFIFGLIIGSFLDCIANRSFSNLSFLGRSFCDHCKKTLPVYALIPVLSYLFLKGKCSFCHKKISPESTLLEIITGLLTAFILFTSLPPQVLSLEWGSLIILGSELIFKLFAVYVFIVVFITDIKSGLIPDRITYPSIIFSIVFLISISAFKVGLFYFSLKNSQLGQYLLPPNSDYFYRHTEFLLLDLGWALGSGIAVGLFFLILILVTRGRGMGGGDMKLGVFIGLVLSFPNSLAAIMLSFLLGSVFGIILIASKVKKFGQTIPFGPFLSLSSIIILLWGEKIINWYLNFKLF